MSTIARVASFQDLLAFLVEARVPHQIDAESQVVEMRVPGGSLFVRWEKSLPYVQIIQPMVRDVPPARLSEVEHAICCANNFVPVPGFGYEHKRSFIYMRLCVPMYEEGMLAHSFDRQMQAVVQNAKEFTSAFKKVVEGAPGEQVVSLAIAENRAPASTSTW